MKIFLKGFCIGLLCLSLLGLLWFLVLQPGLTNREAQDLKEGYAQPLPGESSGELPAGKEQPEPESLVDLSALQAKYPDIKGWISIPGTCVDYPVLQSSADEPEYYLRRTYKGEHRTAGSIFFQWDCSPESKNLVVYGHNMNDGSMLASIRNYKDQEYYNEHPVMYLNTPTQNYKIEIFSAYTTDAESDTYKMFFESEADFARNLDDWRVQSLVSTNVDVSVDDRVITLSTCTYEFYNARFVIQGKLTPVN